MPIFTDNRSASIAAWGENQFLGHIRDWLGDTNPPAPRGMGDDCSVTPLQGCNLLTTDSLLYGRHFDAQLPAEWAGMKLMNRNVSDIAAMGGLPRFALLSGCFPAQTDQRWMEAFIVGLAKAARRWDIQILGGDLAQTEAEWMATVTLIGSAEKPLLRNGGEIGDSIWVTGALGGSLLGRHARFEPRIQEGRHLAQSGSVKAAMDLSDGLAKDLPALMGSDLCAIIDPAAIPVHADAERLSQESSRPAVEHAACDGEDYELLFVLDGRIKPEEWLADWNQSLQTPLHCIGRVEAATEALPVINAQTRQAFSWSHGYQHFQ